MSAAAAAIFTKAAAGFGVVCMVAAPAVVLAPKPVKHAVAKKLGYQPKPRPRRATRARPAPIADAPMQSCIPDLGPMPGFGPGPGFTPSSFPGYPAPLSSTPGAWGGGWVEHDGGFLPPPVAPQPPNISTVPEPSGWAMLIAGFGLVGLAMRKERSVA